MAKDGRDYFRTVLNRAARVMAAGHSGQILVADSTAGLLSGVDLIDLGPRRLRDLPNAITVFQLFRIWPRPCERFFPRGRRIERSLRRR
jgi:class 3 adenylate cyclase